MTVLDLRRNDVPGALALYRERLRDSNRDDLRGLCEMLTMLHDDPDRFVAAFAEAFPPEA
jgi:hypothetical protein